MRVTSARSIGTSLPSTARRKGATCAWKCGELSAIVAVQMRPAPVTCVFAKIRNLLTK